MDKEKAMEHVKSLITSKAVKRTALAAVILSVLGGGAAFYVHQERSLEKVAIAATRNEAIRADMEEKGYTIISESEARRIAAEAIGKSESELHFTKVKLAYDDDRHDQGDRKHGRDKHHDGRERDERHDRADNHQQGAMPQGNQPMPMMHPVYEVEARTSTFTEYDVEIDAVTGEVIDVDLD